MLKLCRVIKVKVFLLELVHFSNFDLFEFSAAIMERGLLFFYSQCNKSESADGSYRGSPLKLV